MCVCKCASIPSTYTLAYCYTSYRPVTSYIDIILVLSIPFIPVYFPHISCIIILLFFCLLVTTVYIYELISWLSLLFRSILMFVVICYIIYLCVYCFTRKQLLYFFRTFVLFCRLGRWFRVLPFCFRLLPRDTSPFRLFLGSGLFSFFDFFFFIFCSKVNMMYYSVWRVDWKKKLTVIEVIEDCVGIVTVVGLTSGCWQRGAGGERGGNGCSEHLPAASSRKLWIVLCLRRRCFPIANLTAVVAFVVVCARVLCVCVTRYVRMYMCVHIQLLDYRSAYVRASTFAIGYRATRWLPPYPHQRQILTFNPVLA